MTLTDRYQVAAAVIIIWAHFQFSILFSALMLLFWWCTLLMVVNIGLTIKSPGADIDESAKEDQTLTTLIDPSNVALLMF